MTRKHFVPRDYQVQAEQWALHNPKSGLFLRMGLGKTAVCLRLINRLRYDHFSIFRTLVIAPRLVAEDVWVREPGQWHEFAHLTTSLIAGSRKKREQAVAARADIHIISRDNFTWLVEHMGMNFNFDLIIVDESQSFKSPTSNRTKALHQVAGYAKRVVLLSGTAAPNGLLDLWSQMFVLDRGWRLAPVYEMYRDWFFQPGSLAKIGRKKELRPTSYVPRPGAEQNIWGLVGQLCLSMDSKTYLTLPKLTETNVMVKLPPKALEAYKKLEKTSVLRLTDADIIAGSAAALGNKLMQVALGTAYDDDQNSAIVHSAMIDACAETREAMNGSVLIFYQFRHDLTRLLEKFPKAQHLTSPDQIKAWDAGEIPELLAHPASAGHGLNLQHGGHNVIWFGLTWNLEHFEQANTRVYRSGQTEDVTIARLIPEGTIHEEVLLRLEDKAQTQDMLMDAIKARRDMYFTESQR